MPHLSNRTDLPGRILATVIILVGVGILFFVFTTALHLFSQPITGLGLPAKPHADTPSAAGIGAAFAVFGQQVLLLTVMTVAGSLIASKGIHLYYGTLLSPHQGRDIPAPHDSGQ